MLRGRRDFWWDLQGKGDEARPGDEAAETGRFNRAADGWAPRAASKPPRIGPLHFLSSAQSDIDTYTHIHTHAHRDTHTPTHTHTYTHLHTYTSTHRPTDTNTLHSHARLGRTAMAAVRAPSPSFLSAFLPVARATLFPDAAPMIRRPPLLHTLRTSLLPAVLVPLPALLGDLWDGLLNAVPKKKTSHMKKRHRQMAGKALKDVTALNKCSACGRVKRAHVLCPYCVQSRSRPCALRR